MPIKIGAIAIFLFAGTTPGLAQEVEIGGRYTALGTNFNGSKYSGAAEIVVTARSTCRITWRTGTGAGSVQNGICMRNGATLAAAYTFPNGRPGLVIYDIQPDGRLIGRWTMADQNGIGGEDLVPVR